MECEDIELCHFDRLPKEIKQLIFLKLNLNLKEALKLQPVSKRWKEILWQSVTDVDTNLLKLEEYEPRANFVCSLFPRLNLSNISKLSLHWRENQFRNYAEKCINLEYLSTGIPVRSYEVTDTLKNLAEVSAEFESPKDLLNYSETAPFKVNGIISDGGVPMAHTEPFISPKINFCQASVDHGGESVQKEPIKLDKKFQCGGMLGDEFVVIGATDGTLVFLKLDLTNKTLTEHSSNNIHKGCINEIFNEKTQSLHVASSDGIVTSWGHKDNKPELKQIYQFPEEILFVCDTCSHHVIATSKRTIYAADMTSGEIKWKQSVNSDITGVHGSQPNFRQANVATLTTFYRLNYNHISDSKAHADVLQESVRTNTPNFWVTPCSSFRGIIYPHEVTFVEMNNDVLIQRFPHPEGTNFDSRPNLLRFNPAKYWVTVSTGTNIINYFIENSTIIWSLSPHVSRSEIEAKKFPVCNALWYNVSGDFLFSLFSNDTLCWWHLTEVKPNEMVQTESSMPADSTYSTPTE